MCKASGALAKNLRMRSAPMQIEPSDSCAELEIDLRLTPELAIFADAIGLMIFVPSTSQRIQGVC